MSPGGKRVTNGRILLRCKFFAVRIKPMHKPLPRKPILAERAIDGLMHAKQQILDAVGGKVPERLMRATTLAAVRLARQEVAPADVLSERVVQLVGESLLALAQRKWKPDTALLLHEHGRMAGMVLNKAIRRALLKLGSAAEPTDGDLLARFVATQEQAAFEELLGRHGPMVLRVCQRVLSPHPGCRGCLPSHVYRADAQSPSRCQARVGGWLVARRGLPYGFECKKAA